MIPFENKPKINCKFHELFKLGYISLKVPDSIFLPIKNDVDNLISNNFVGLQPHNYLLAGVIEKEFSYEKAVDSLQPFLNDVARTYYQQWQDELAKETFIFQTVLENKPSIWLNFQKKHEYNPPHMHSGLLSFVLWVKVPYTMDEEVNRCPFLSQGIEGSALNNDNKFRKSIADFQFLIPDPFSAGGISHHTIPVDKSYEGVLILFHAGLWHLVNPFFTSDDYRVSLSGNLVIKEQ